MSHENQEYLNCGARMSDNKQSQQIEENANIDLEEKTTQAN